MKVLLACTLLVLLMAFCGQLVHAQPAPAAEVASWRQALQLSSPDTNRVRLLLRLGANKLMNWGEATRDIDSARTYGQQALALSRKLGYQTGEGLWLNLAGDIYKEERNYQMAIATQQAAINFFRREQNTRRVVESYTLLFVTQREQGDSVQARRNAQTAFALAERHGHWAQAGEAYVKWGFYFDVWQGQLPQRIAAYRRAVQQFEKAQLKERQADVLKDLGDLENLRGNRLQALKDLTQALSLYQSLNYKRLHGVYDLLGYVSTTLGNYQAGVRYGLLSVKTAIANQDTSLQLCTFYNRLGLSYSQLKQYQKAYQCYDQSLAIAVKWQDRSSIVTVSGNKAKSLLMMGRPTAALETLDFYTRRYPPLTQGDSIITLISYLAPNTTLGRYPAARRYYQQLVNLKNRIELTQDPNYLSKIYTSLITYNLKAGQYDNAKLILNKTIPFNKKYGTVNELANNYLWMSKVDSAQARHLSALKFYQQYKSLEDSLFNQIKSSQIASLEVEYDTEQKEQNILLKQQRIDLLTKQAALQEQQLKKDRLVRNVVIGGVGLLLLLLFAVVNRYRLKQRSNQLLQVQQREINDKNRHLSELLEEQCRLLDKQKQLLTEKQWLLKEVHHRVKNNLQVVMSLLNSQASYLSAGAALAAIQESQHRVQAMALIHQRLYQSDLGAHIAMPAYINDLANYLRDSFDLPQPIHFELDIEPIELDAALAVPVGLIINEAITNALKYAFPGGRPGQIVLRLYRLPEATYQLEIEDNGIGLPADFAPQRSRSLGMTLILGLSQQLGGKLRWDNEDGLKLTLTFHDEQLAPALASISQPA